jgi:hypothetical protein
LILGLGALFAKALSRRRERIAAVEAQAAINGGLYLAASQAGVASKTWVTRRDDQVRAEHRVLDSVNVPLAEGFSIGGASLRYPGDPTAPPALSLGCRCRLRFNQ